MRPKLLVDIDGVLVEQGDRLRTLTLSVTGGRVRLEPGDCRHYDFTECVSPSGARMTKEEWREVCRLYADPEALATLPVAPGAAVALLRLSATFDIAIVTTRGPEMRDATERWLARWTTFPHTLQMVPYRRKHEVPGISVAVEDDYDQAVLFAESGVPCYLIRWPWNAERPARDGITWVSGWSELCSRILESR